MVAEAERAGVPVLRAARLLGMPLRRLLFRAGGCSGPADPAARIAQDEVFGPVLTLFSFETEAEAVALANGTEYGLVAGVWTKDGARQHRCRQARARRPGLRQRLWRGRRGGAALRRLQALRPRPREGFEALYDMSATKTVVFNHG